LDATAIARDHEIRDPRGWIVGSIEHVQEGPMSRASRWTTDEPARVPDTTTGVAGGVSYWRYHTAGTGPRRDPVMVLHGLGADHLGLRELVQAIPAVDVVELDLPGFGRSAPLPGRHTIAGYARTVEGLRVALGLDSVNVVGHSLGADIALAYAGLYPTGVRTLTLLHPVIDGGGATTWLARAYYRIGTWLPAVFARVWLLSRPAIYAADAVLFTTGDRARRRHILEEDYRTAAAASPRAISEAYLSLAETPFHDLAGRIAAPTLLVTGGRDALAGRRTLTALRTSIAGSHDVIIDGAGHLWPVEEPRAAAEVVARNLR
jgi:pimeloyl-ACP methyl ester carboxylesterase